MHGEIVREIISLFELGFVRGIRRGEFPVKVGAGNFTHLIALRMLVFIEVIIRDIAEHFLLVDVAIEEYEAV